VIKDCTGNTTAPGYVRSGEEETIDWQGIHDGRKDEVEFVCSVRPVRFSIGDRVSSFKLVQVNIEDAP
jgi:hypothetical protein